MSARKPLRSSAPRRAGLLYGKWKELDRLCRTVVMLAAGAALLEEDGRERWYGQCQRCAKTGWLSWCHVFTRAAVGTRWDPDNSWAWCAGCHRLLDQHWEKKLDWVLQRIGEQRWAALRLRKEAGRRPDYAAVKLSLEAERKALLGQP